MNELQETHSLIGQISEKDPENIFALMQREFWSPGGQAARLIRSIGADHISMKSGDIVQINELLWVCTPQGWIESEIEIGHKEKLEKPQCDGLRKPYYDVSDGMSSILGIAHSLRTDDEEFYQKVQDIIRGIDTMKTHMDKTYNWD